MQIDWQWHESKGREFGYALFEDVPLFENTDDINSTDDTDIMLIHVLDDQNIADLQDIKTVQRQDAYCRYILNSLHIPSVCDKFLKQENILYILVQDGDKSFEALVIPKFLYFLAKETSSAVETVIQAHWQHIYVTTDGSLNLGHRQW